MKKGILHKSEAFDRGFDVHKSYYLDRHYSRLVDQWIEESSELTKALLKERRGRQVEEAIYEEIYDVLLCLEYLIREKNLSNKKIDEGIMAKSERIVKALAKGKE